MAKNSFVAEVTFKYSLFGSIPLEFKNFRTCFTIPEGHIFYFKWEGAMFILKFYYTFVFYILCTNIQKRSLGIYYVFHFSFSSG